MLSRKEHLVLAAVIAGLTLVFPSAHTQAQCKKGAPQVVIQQRNCNNTSTITQQRNGGQQISLMLNLQLQQQNQLQKSQLQQGQLQQGQLQQAKLQQAQLQRLQLQQLQQSQIQQAKLQQAQLQQRLQNQQLMQLQLQQGLQQQALRQQQQNFALLTIQQQQNMQQQNQQQNALQNGPRNQQGPQGRLSSKDLLTALEKQRDKNEAAIRFDQQGGQMTDKQRKKNITDLRTALERTTSLLDGMEGQRHEQEALDVQSTLMQQQSTMRNALVLAGGA